MSRESDTELPTPKSKSSTSAIFEAFKNLTGGNKNRRSAPQSTGNQTGSAIRSPETPSPQHVRETLKRIQTEPHRGSNAGSDKFAQSASVIGGPVELQNTVDRLRSENAIGIRIQAARDISKLLARYPVQDVDTIWSTGSDLLLNTDISEAIESAYDLLFACVEYKTLIARERVTFLEAITGDERPETLASRIKILCALTSGAKYVDHLEIFIAPLVSTLLQQAYTAAVAARRKKVDENCMTLVFDYTLALLKYNASVLSKSDLTSLINRVLDICRMTGAKSDLGSSIDIIDGVITYSLLPESKLIDCLGVLCGIYYQVDSHQEQAFATIRRIINSHLAPQVSDALLSLIRNEHASNTLAPMRGAVLVSKDILASPKDASTVSLTIADLLAALKQGNVLETPRVACSVLRILSSYAEEEHKVKSLFEPALWDDFCEVLTKCSRRQEVLGYKNVPGSDLARSKSSAKSNESSPTSECSSLLKKIVHHLMMLCEDEDFEDDRAVMDLVTSLNIASQLDDLDAQALIEHYNREYLLQPPSEEWLENCRRLQIALFNDQQRTASIRLLCLDSLRDAYSMADVLNVSGARDFCLEILSSIGKENNMAVIESLCSIAVETATWTADRELFTSILDYLALALPQENDTDTNTSRPLSHDSMLNEDALVVSNFSDVENTKIIVTSFVRLLLRNLQKSFWKADTLFIALLDIAKRAVIPVEARIIAFKTLARLRSDVNHSVFIINDPGCESLAAALCRTRQTAKTNDVGTVDSPVQRPSRPQEQTPRRQNQSAPAAAPHRLMNSTRSVSGIFKLASPTVSPTWMYGGIKGLPEDPPFAGSRVLFSHLDVSPTDVRGESTEPKSSGVLKVNLWLELVISLLQQKELDWELYSYLIVHIGAQITNHSLFIDAIPQIKLLRNVLCNQLSNKNFADPPPYTHLKKGDVAVCLFDILTMLLSHREHFARSEQEEMVKVFASGIGTWERTSEFCIHALLVCCLELPMPVTRVLDSILSQMTKIITQAHVAVHVLEFLAGLARLPELFLNFREAEYKNVFALCSKYLQFVRDQRRKAVPINSNRMSKSYAAQQRMSKDISFQLDTSTAAKTLADELPQYVYALAYHVMAFFFMSLRLKYRPHYVNFIAQKLTYRNEDGKEVVEEQSEVLLDYMNRIAYSDRDETAPDPDFAKLSDGRVFKKSWVVGSEILTVETAARTGVSQLTRRRPSGTKHSVLQPHLVSPPRHQVPITYGFAADAYYSDDYIGVTPDDIVQEMHSSLSDLPIPLPDDAQTQRSIDTFDRISALDGHKVGIIYVGEGQTDQSTILANVMGSEDYTAFLNGIGTLTELKGAKFNTQGLDREFDGDGKFTFCWRNRVTELVFHVTTMMPTNLEDDPHCNMKKRHTGNDFVNIIFNNSGLVFDFDTFPSDFNYVNIVIVPDARMSFVETRLRANELRRRTEEDEGQSTSYFPSDNATINGQEGHEPVSADMFYKVTVHVKEGLPAISPAAETKIISGKSLPAFVRLLALNASVFAQVWANKDTGEHVSSWRSRLREIRRLRERHVGTMVAAALLEKDREMHRDSRILAAPDSRLMSPTIAAISPALSQATSSPAQIQPFYDVQTSSPAARDSGLSGMGATGTISSGLGGGGGNGAVGLLRRVSQAAFSGDSNMSDAGGKANGVSITESMERSSSVSSKASTRE